MKTIKCGKCNGTGYISGFAHVREGICFDCNGSGELVKPKRPTVTFSRAFINEYAQKGYTPPVDDETKLVLCTGHEGHKTAEQWIMEKNGAFVFGQPFCGGSSWYVIPKEIVNDFFKHYNKARRTNIQFTLNS